MAKRPKRLSTAELGAIAEASLLNSLALLDDAEALAEQRRWPRAFALAVLAGEEFGKVMMCLGALGNPRADEDDYWHEFWQRFTGHRPKYENVFNMATAFLEEDAATEMRKQAVEHTQADQEMKMAAFYVDYTNDGLSLPWVRVDAGDAEAALTVYGTVIRSWAQSAGPDIAQRMVLAEAEARRFQEARATGDPGAVARVLREQFGHEEEE